MPRAVGGGRKKSIIFLFLAFSKSKKGERWGKKGIGVMTEKFPRFFLFNVQNRKRGTSDVSDSRRGGKGGDE